MCRHALITRRGEMEESGCVCARLARRVLMVENFKGAGWAAYWLVMRVDLPTLQRSNKPSPWIHPWVPNTPTSTRFTQGCFLLRALVHRAQQETALGRVEGARDRHPWMNPWARIVRPYRARTCGCMHQVAPGGNRGRSPARPRIYIRGSVVVRGTVAADRGVKRSSKSLRTDLGAEVRHRTAACGC